jgi:hypothetical protein
MKTHVSCSRAYGQSVSNVQQCSQYNSSQYDRIKGEQRRSCCNINGRRTQFRTEYMKIRNSCQTYRFYIFTVDKEQSPKDVTSLCIYTEKRSIKPNLLILPFAVPTEVDWKLYRRSFLYYSLTCVFGTLKILIKGVMEIIFTDDRSLFCWRYRLS